MKATSRSTFIFCTMPVNSSVDRALAAIEKDPSKLLEVHVGGNPITKAQYIPRAGKTHHSLLTAYYQVTFTRG